MTEIKNKPRHWNRMPFSAKAGFLCATAQAKDFSHACSILAKRRAKAVAPTVDAKKRWDLQF